ncbi:MAG: bacillithiol biosynthesis cysteine-adding enzyme BshC [Bacteroidetes bacterium]|nr:bacillithiol biosynthesis cysteine-adding enzyme BshC [Bacteroidota bacterium]
MKLFAKYELAPLGLIPPIVSDYLNREPQLRSQVNSWLDIEEFEKLISEKTFLGDRRKSLVYHLLSQYKIAGIEVEKQKSLVQQINSLNDANTFTVTTGHQLSLFGGTLFMAYKILTTIKLARDLKAKYPQHHFVPILWLASEDHDFEEIKGTYWQGKQLNWELETHEKASGEIPTESISNIVKMLGSSLEEMGGIGHNLKQWIEDAYLGRANLGDASIAFYHYLFGKEGLVILDANAPALKKDLAPVMEKDLFTNTLFEKQQASDRVLTKKYKLQINARNGNFFYLHPQLGRKLLKKEKDAFALGDTDIRYSKEELQQVIQNNPELLSPNVNIRPIYQEIILPNLAYVGGPAEIAYWLQLKPLFDACQVNFPMLVLRFMATQMESGFEEKLRKFGFDSKEIFGSEEQVGARYLEKVQPIDYSKISEEIGFNLQGMVDAVKHSDPELAKVLLQLKLETRDNLKKQSGAFKRALEKKEEEGIRKILKLRSKFYPNGVLQERIETVLHYQLKVGPGWNNKILELVEPTHPAMHLIQI